MVNCPNCGYVLGPFETDCPRCDRQEKGFSPPLTAAPAKPCPNCGQPVADGKTVCPNCGMVVQGIWPPPPAGTTPPAPPAGKLVTGRPTGDFALGLVISVASFFLMCLGLIVMPLLYLAFSRTYPAFARGIGWGWLLILLGAVTVCFGPAIWQQWAGH